MLYEISKELQTELKARNVPIPVVYGPERGDVAISTSERIIIERARPGNDAFDPGKHRVRNPQQRHVVMTSAVCRLVVASAAAGARALDHERRQETLRDQVLNAMDKVVSVRKSAWQPLTGGLLSSDQLAGLETLRQWPGVVYEFAFVVARGTKDVAWDGSAATEVEFGDGVGEVGIVSRTRAILVPAPDGTDPETACGVDP